MPLDIAIAPLEKTDIPAVVAIEQSSQLEPWSSNSFAEELDRLHSHLFVARLGKAERSAGAQQGEIRGYICFWLIVDEVQILNIAVQESFRRQGIARALLEHAIRFGREGKANLVTLEVRKSNVPARKLYENMGFKVVGERPNYYGVRNEPAVLMELELNRERD